MPATTSIPSISKERTIPPASRASWTGSLTFDDISIPVKAYSLSVTTPSGPLCQIHAGCSRKLEYRKCCPEHGQISHDQIGKAYPYAENDLIELTEQELQPLAPNPENVVTLKQFFEPDQFDWAFLSGRSFALVPAHAAAHVPYLAFVEALEESEVYGFGTIGLSGRVQLLVARVVQQRIVLFLLHWPAQRRAAPAISPVKGAETATWSHRFLRQILEQVGPITWEQVIDDWEPRLTELVQQKVAERMIPTVLPVRRRRSTTTRSKGTSRSRPPRKSRAA
ncbi:MAG TPA: Ku protein [Planctomicrobium sp.]|nr:Ku protein [Planctomicrobium sp.]